MRNTKKKDWENSIQERRENPSVRLKSLQSLLFDEIARIYYKDIFPEDKCAQIKDALFPTMEGLIFESGTTGRLISFKDVRRDGGAIRIVLTRMDTHADYEVTVNKFLYILFRGSNGHANFNIRKNPYINKISRIKINFK